MKYLKCFLGAPSLSNFVSISLLFVRIVMGVAFMFHGWGKIQNPMTWMGVDSPVPGFFQFLAALSEFGGGLALVLGLLTQVSALGLAFTMLVATLFHMVFRQDPFVNLSGGPSYELALVYLAMSVLFISTGAGRFSLDHYVFGAKK